MPSEEVGSAYCTIGLDSKNFESGLNSARGKFTDFADDIEGRAKRLGSAIGSALTTGLMVATAAISGALVGGTKAFMDYEQSLANVAKTVDGTTAQINALGEANRTLANGTGIAVTSLNGVSATLGSLGVAYNDIATTTELVGKGSIAFGMDAETMATQVAKVAQVFDLPISKSQTWLSSMNALGNATSATEPEILTFTQSIAALSTMYDEPIEKTEAFGATLISSGVDATEGATSIRSALEYAMTDKKGTRMASWAKLMGTDVQGLNTMLSEDLYGTLAKSASALNNIGSETERNKVAMDLWGSYGFKVMGTLASTADQYDKNLQTVYADAASGSQSMNQEFNRQNDTLQGSWNKVLTGINDVGITIGAVTSGPVKGFFDAFVAGVPKIKEFASALMSGDWGTVGSMLQEGFRGALSTLESLGNTAWDGIVSAAGSINWQAVGLALYGGVVWGVDKLKQAGSTILGYLTGVDWDQVGTAIWNGIMTFVSGVASLGASILTALEGINWSAVGASILNDVKTVLSGAASLGSSVLSSLLSVDWSGVGTSILNGVKSVLSGAASLGSSILKSLENVNWSEIGAKIWDGISTIKSKVVDIGTWIWDSLNNVKWDNLGNTIGATLHTAIESGISLLSDIGEKIKGFINTSDFSATGASIGQNIKDGIATVSGWMDQVKAGFLIGWGDTGQKIGEAIKAGISLVKDFHDAILSDIKDWINTGGAKTLGYDVGSAIADGIKAMIDVGAWFLENLKDKGGGNAIVGAFQTAVDWLAIGTTAVADFTTSFIAGFGSLGSYITAQLTNAIIESTALMYDALPYGMGQSTASDLRKNKVAVPSGYSSSNTNEKTAAEQLAEWEAKHSSGKSSSGSYSSSSSSASTSSDLTTVVEKIVDGKLVKTVSMALDGTEFPLKSNGNLSIVGDIYNPQIATSSGNVSPEDFMRKAAAQGMSVTEAYNLLEDSYRSQFSRVKEWDMSSESWAKDLGVAYAEGQKEWEAAKDASAEAKDAAIETEAAANELTQATEKSIQGTNTIFDRLAAFRSQFSGSSTAAITGLNAVTASAQTAATSTQAASSSVDAASTALTVGAGAIRIGLTEDGREIAVIGRVAQANFSKAGGKWVDDSAQAGTQFKQDGADTGTQFKLDGTIAGQNLAAAIDPSGPNFYDWVDRAGQALLSAADSVLSALSSFGSSVAGQLAKLTSEANKQLASNQSISAYSAAVLGNSTAALGLAKAVVSNADVAYLKGSQSINANSVQITSPTSTLSTGTSTLAASSVQVASSPVSLAASSVQVETPTATTTASSSKIITSAAEVSPYYSDQYWAQDYQPPTITAPVSQFASSAKSSNYVVENGSATINPFTDVPTYSVDTAALMASYANNPSYMRPTGELATWKPQQVAANTELTTSQQKVTTSANLAAAANNGVYDSLIAATAQDGLWCEAHSEFAMQQENSIGLFKTSSIVISDSLTPAQRAAYNSTANLAKATAEYGATCEAVSPFTLAQEAALQKVSTSFIGTTAAYNALGLGADKTTVQLGGTSGSVAMLGSNSGNATSKVTALGNSVQTLGTAVISGASSIQRAVSSWNGEISDSAMAQARSILANQFTTTSYKDAAGNKYSADQYKQMSDAQKKQLTAVTESTALTQDMINAAFKQADEYGSVTLGTGAVINSLVKLTAENGKFCEAMSDFGLAQENTIGIFQQSYIGPTSGYDQFKELDAAIAKVAAGLTSSAETAASTTTNAAVSNADLSTRTTEYNSALQTIAIKSTGQTWNSAVAKSTLAETIGTTHNVNSMKSAFSNNLAGVEVGTEYFGTGVKTVADYFGNAVVSAGSVMGVNATYTAGTGGTSGTAATVTVTSVQGAWGGTSVSGGGGWIGTTGGTGMNGGSYTGSTYGSGNVSWGGAAASNAASSGSGSGGNYGSVQWAEGGIVTQPTWGLAGEAGREAFVPLYDKAAGWRVLKQILPEFGISTNQLSESNLGSISLQKSSPITIDASIHDCTISSDVDMKALLDEQRTKIMKEVSYLLNGGGN